MMRTLLLFYFFNAFYLKSQTFPPFSWAKLLDGFNAIRVKDIKVDKYNNVYTLGTFAGSIDLDPGPGSCTFQAVGYNDAYLVKLDASGNFIWGKDFSGSQVDANSFTFDPLNNIYMVGGFYGNADFDPGLSSFNLTAGNFDAFICKLDSSGNFIWAKKTYSNDYEEYTSVALDSNEDIYVTGNFLDTVDFDPGPGVYNLISNGDFDISVCKFDPLGNFIWAKQIGGLNVDKSVSLTLDLNNDLYVTGTFDGTCDFDPGISVYTLTPTGSSMNPTVYNSFIVKLNSSGNFIWANKFGSTSGYSYASSIKTDKYGDVYTCGIFSKDINYGSNNISTIYNGSYITKLNSSGNCSWLKAFTSPFMGINSICIDDAGYVYTSGGFNNVTDFDPGPATYTLASGDDALFISKLDNNGNFINVLPLYAGNCPFSLCTPSSKLFCSVSGELYLAGNGADILDFDNGPGIFSLGGSFTESFVAKFSDTTAVGINEVNLQEINLQLYPNPTDGNAILKCDKNIFISVYNSLGEQVLNQNLLKGKNNINLGNQSAGIYFLRVNNTSKSIKIIKE